LTKFLENLSNLSAQTVQKSKISIFDAKKIFVLPPETGKT